MYQFLYSNWTANKPEIIRSWANSSRSRLKEYGLQHLVKIAETVNSREPYTFRPNMVTIRAYTFRSPALFVKAIKDAILILKEQKKQGWCLIKPPIRTDRITPINQGKCIFIRSCHSFMHFFVRLLCIQSATDFQIRKNCVWSF